MSKEQCPPIADVPANSYGLRRDDPNKIGLYNCPAEIYNMIMEHFTGFVSMTCLYAQQSDPRLIELEGPEEREYIHHTEHAQALVTCPPSNHRPDSCR